MERDDPSAEIRDDWALKADAFDDYESAQCE